MTTRATAIIMRLMRGSLIANAILASGLLLVSLAGTSGCSSCKKKEQAKPASEEGMTAEGGEAAPEDDEKKKRRRQRGEGMSARFALLKITPEEVKPLIPQIKGAKMIGEPNVTAGGRRITATQCIDEADLPAVKADLLAKLAELGFTPRRGARERPGIVAISAEKAPYRFSATVRSGPYPDCPGDQKKAKMLMSFFKRPLPKDGSPDPASLPPQGGAQGGAVQGRTAPAPPPEGGSQPAPAEPTK